MMVYLSSSLFQQLHYLHSTNYKNMNSYKIIDHEYDVVVLGVEVQDSESSRTWRWIKTTVFRKFSNQNHTSVAQGGISATLGNMGEDDWRWHI